MLLLNEFKEVFDFALALVNHKVLRVRLRQVHNGWVATHLIFIAETSIDSAIDLTNVDQTRMLNCEFLPRGCEMFAVTAPGRVKLDEPVNFLVAIMLIFKDNFIPVRFSKLKNISSARERCQAQECR